MVAESQDSEESSDAESRVASSSARARPWGAWERFKTHKVAQLTLGYVAAGYAPLQGTEMLSNALDWPHSIVRLLTLVLLLGLPLVATLAWYPGHRSIKRVSGAELTIISVLLVLAGTALWHFAPQPEEHAASILEKPAASTDAAAQPVAARPPKRSITPFNPPPHSVAVLSFVNMSGDSKDEYFSDGLSEELLNTLARINELQVAARTSSFSFKGTAVDIPTVGRKLNVAAVLEGSVRKAGEQVRITAQLINAVSGYHLWSQTYDRDLKDIFALQTEIASAVAAAMPSSQAA